MVRTWKSSLDLVKFRNDWGELVRAYSPKKIKDRKKNDDDEEDEMINDCTNKKRHGD